MDLADSVVIVTGASSGIGAALVRALVGHGARVVLAARREPLLRALAREVDPSGRQTLVVPTDVTLPAEAEALVRRALEGWGRLDVLVNNAGRGHCGLVEETDDATLQNMFALNAFALWYVSRPALRAMKAQGRGHIITVASMAGKIGFPLNSAYVAAKHAAVGFTHALRMELLGTNIHASVVCPGGVATPWADVTEGAPMRPVFAAAAPVIEELRGRTGQAGPAIEGVIAPARVAEAICACIHDPAAEVYTHLGSKAFADFAQHDREASERQQAPFVQGECEAYRRLHEE